MPINLEHKKFLVVDDFDDFRRMITKMLRSIGANDIDDADSGDRAIKYMLEKKYDVILCDYHFGNDKKDGQQILEEAKHRELMKYSSVFIMVTTENTMAMVMGAVEYLPDDYLIKPVNKMILQSRMEKIIKKKEDFEEIEKAIRNNNIERAIALCEEQVRNNPKNILEYLRLKGDLCIKIKRYDEANSVFKEVLAERDISWAQMGLGKVAFMSGDFARAKDIFELVIEGSKTVMEAYDWLAKTLKELGAMEEAQQVLKGAIEISPNALLRHKEVGDISYAIHDFDTAEEAFKSAIEIGKNSCFKSAVEYTSLAKTLVKKDKANDALLVINKARNEFKKNPSAMLQTTIAEGTIYKEMDREEDAARALNEATKIFEEMSGNVSVDVTMDLAKVCFELGEKEIGMNIVQRIVRNNHDNDEVIKNVQDILNEAELQEEGEKVIDSIKNQIIQLNNKGVHLVEEGKLDEAIEYFEKAVKGFADSKIINANAAYTLLKYMEKNGISDQHLLQVSQYLDKVKKIDPSYAKYRKLLRMYEQIGTSETKPFT